MFLTTENTFSKFQKDDLDSMALEDRKYHGDISLLSPKSKILSRDNKKELMRYKSCDLSLVI